jgi:hypothetical protein
MANKSRLAGFDCGIVAPEKKPQQAIRISLLSTAATNKLLSRVQ